MGEIKKPDLNKIGSVEVHNTQNTSQNKISSQPVQPQNPEVIVGTKNTKLIVTIVSFVMALVFTAVALVLCLPQASSPNDIKIQLGADIKYDVSGESELPEGTTITLMPGDSLNSKFSVSSKSLDENNNVSEVFIRVKIYTLVEENYFSNLFAFDMASNEWVQNWMVGADGFMYLRKTLVADSSVEFANKLTLDKNIDSSLSGKTINLVFYVEALQAERQAIESYWQTSPQTWRDEVVASKQF